MPKATDEDQTLIGISFGDPFRAQEFLTAANRLNANESIEMKDAVVVVKDDDGRVNVRETIDPQPGRTALSGGMWAGLFGLILGGPVGWIAGAAVGAGAGVVTARVVDLGIPDDWVEWFRKAVQPGTATVALLVGDFDRDTLVAEVARFSGAQLIYANVDAALHDRLAGALGTAAATLSDQVE